MHSRPLTMALGAIIFLTLLFFVTEQFHSRQTWSSYRFGDVNATQSATAGVVDKEIFDEIEYSVEDQVTNSTLGFAKIFAIGLPERTDRRDRLTLMTSYQNVSISWIDAIPGASVEKKTWPPNWHEDSEEFFIGALGCWRSHVNTLRKIVEEGHATALILEDDADWDVDLKQQLVTYANATRTIENDIRPEGQKLTATTPTRSPYGDYWDVLWLGSCQNPDGPSNSIIFPGKGGTQYWVWREKGSGTACTFGYAVTLESARELLAFMQDATKPYDLMLSDVCAKRECIIMWPRLISMHRPAGSSIQDSDIRDMEPEVRTTGYTPMVQDSAILDAFERVKGERKRERPNLYGEYSMDEQSRD